MATRTNDGRLLVVTGTLLTRRPRMPVVLHYSLWRNLANNRESLADTRFPPQHGEVSSLVTLMRKCAALPSTIPKQLKNSRPNGIKNANGG